MKKVISVILAVWLLIIQTAVSANEYKIQLSAVTDPIEGVITVNGELSSGADGRISVVVCDSENSVVFADEMISSAEGVFKTKINTKVLANGDYTAVFRAENTEPAEFDFTLPLSNSSAVKLDAKIDGNDILLISDNAPDKDFSVIKINVSNAVLIQGKLSEDDYEVTGLPSGYNLEGKAVSANTVEFTLKGSGAVADNCDIGIKLNSTIIKSGKANTASDEIKGIVLYTEEAGNTVNLNTTEFNAYMTDERNVDSTRSTADIGVKIRKLAKNGILEKGIDYDYTIPPELQGVKCDVTANLSMNVIRVKFSGTLTKNLTKNAVITDFVIKTACVDGTKKDSLPVKIVFNYTSSQNNTSGGSGSGGNGGGGNNGGGYTGGGSQNTVNITPNVPKLEINFNDIKGHWAENEINTLAGDGIVNGVGDNMFEPNRSISRAEFVTLTVKAFKITEGSYDGSFSDVASNAWYASAVGKALESGIISKDDNFRPNDPITREEMVKMIVGGWLINNERPQWITMAQFSDKQAVSDWAKDYIDIAVTLGLVKGDNEGRFNPKNNTTRAESAAVIYRLLYLN